MGLGDFADAEIDGLPGQDGGDVTIGNHPFTAVPSCAWVLQEPRDPTESSTIALSLLIDPLSQFINFGPDLVAVIDHVLKRRRVPSILRK
jgi:hypothetical protein